MTAWYCSRERLKRALPISGSALHPIIDRQLEAESRHADSVLHCEWLPRTATKLFPWPNGGSGSSFRLWTQVPLLSVSALLSEAQESSPTTIPVADYFLEPQAFGPPFTRIEIDLSSSSFFAAGATVQRSISVAGDWGQVAATEAAGALAAQIADTTGTSITVTDASLIDVGDTLLIESERLFVRERSATDTTANTSAALTADKNNTTVAVTDGTKVKAGEVILIDSEKMLVDSVAGNNLAVTRAYDGTTLATHANPSDVYAYRVLTVVRAELGSTAATHANTTAISRYVVDSEISQWVMARALAALSQHQSAWGRTVGQGEGQREARGRSLAELEEHVLNRRRWKRQGAAI